MRVPHGANEALTAGLAEIRKQYSVPTGFAPDVEAAAAAAVRVAVGDEHTDRTDLPFVTLDPASSTDLDQAFCLETAGDDLVLRYAIADVGWFVQPDDPIDREAWQRGTTLYLPDGRAPLYPTVLSEGAASLLPDGPRPAVMFVVRLDQHGIATLDGAERVVIRSRAKLAYTTVTAADLPSQMAEFSRRMAAADLARGASRLEAPEQVVEPDGRGGMRLTYRPRLESEDMNASLSLASNLAVATTLFHAGTGLFRVMDEPDDRAVRRLRHEAKALGVAWPADMSLTDFTRTLTSTVPAQADMIVSVRRAGGAARYEPFRAGVVPWHAAMAATYSHATAPLRRLADRHVVLATLALVNGQPVPEFVAAAFEALPEVMQRADAVGSQIDRAAIDLVEAVVMSGQEGRTFAAVVTDTDERGARIQLRDIAVIARVGSHNVEPGDDVRVKLVEANAQTRQVRFERVA